MHLSSTMFSLPPSLLVLLAAATLAPAQHPTAIRKMSPDEGEKFMPEYYAFGPPPPPTSHQQARAAGLLASDEELLLSSNSSAAIPFLPPYPRHYDYPGAAGLGARTRERRGEEDKEEGNTKRLQQEAASGLYRRAREALSRLQGRQFACPEGTHSCTNIDQPNYCCSAGTTCFVVTNAPDAGNVGCCPEGANCGLSVGLCAGGAMACPASLGGGCCIPGFVCAEVGCVSSTVSVISPSQTQTRTQTVTSTFISSPTPTTQIVTVIVTVTPSGGGEPVTSTTTQTTTAAENTNPETETTSTTNTLGGVIPPYRPTSGTTEAPPTTTTNTAYCPTGFYACEAQFGGGCCRTGRDCSTTSCPATPLTTIVTNGATIAVPVTDAEAAASAGANPTCAVGWFLCGDAGSGCCPEGYACGTASCTLSASTATTTVGKQLPSLAPGGRGRGVWVPGVVVFGAAVLFAAVLA